MSQQLIAAKIQLKQAEMEELKKELILEVQKEFSFISLDEMLNLLKENPNKEYTILSYYDYKDMSLFHRDGRYFPQYLSTANITNKGTLYIGHYPVLDGIPSDDRFRNSDKNGLYVKNS